MQTVIDLDGKVKIVNSSKRTRIRSKKNLKVTIILKRDKTRLISIQTNNNIRTKK